MEFLPNAKELLSLLRTLNKDIKRGFQPKDLNVNEIFLIGMLLEHQYKDDKDSLVQVKEISEKMKVSRPYINKVINGLEEKELVDRVRKPGDKKSVYIALSQKANDIYLGNKQRLISYMNGIVNKLGEEDTLTLIKLIKKLLDIINSEG